jgi:Protein of unknown function (DUF2510)
MATVPAVPSQHRHTHPPLRAAAPGALLGAAAGVAAGLVAAGPLMAALLGLVGALLVVALVAALPSATERGARRATTDTMARRGPVAVAGGDGEARRGGASHPAAEPTSTLALPPDGPGSAPGWYPDPEPPAGAEGVRRLWDGERWTEHRWAPRRER